MFLCYHQRPSREGRFCLFGRGERVYQYILADSEPHYVIRELHFENIEPPSYYGETVMLQWSNSNGVPALHLHQFAMTLAAVLPKLIVCLRSDDLRRHPVWGQLLPFDVPAYGTERSLGHIVRPDVILTSEGPKVCEFDFVPSGRGWVLSSLSTKEQQERFLRPFSDWYTGMGVNEVAYATGSVTTCWEETVFFSDRISRFNGVNVVAVNVDRDPIGDRVIDRLFYRSEVKNTARVHGRTAFTSEPHLDSKMVFAFIHDACSDELLLQFMTPDDLQFLRLVCAETIITRDLRATRPELHKQLTTVQRPGQRQAPERNRWVLKNTDVESNTCWGSRGVVMGCKYGAGQFADALRGNSPRHKDLGRRPVLQRFMPSFDFAPIWDEVVSGQVTASPAALMGKQVSGATGQPASKHVYARVGVYFLVDNVGDRVHVPPYGILTLRQDELAHGSTDALMTAFEVI